MSVPVHSNASLFEAELEPLAWPDRFEWLAARAKSSSEADRAQIDALRARLADAALEELSATLHGIPLKEGILRLPSKRMRGALGQAAKRARDRHVVNIVAAGVPFAQQPMNVGDRVAVGMDERVLEVPLALLTARLDAPGEVLDAGAALNVPVVRELVAEPVARLTHVTLPGANEVLLPGGGDRFILAFADLRSLPYPNAAFDRIVCVSTLEHVGMDNSRYRASTEHAPASASAALRELVRVLAPGGDLLITVPYGQQADHEWFRIFDRASLEELLVPAAAEQVQQRFFYYDAGWSEGGPVAPARVLEADFSPDVITGLAVLRITKRGSLS